MPPNMVGRDPIPYIWKENLKEAYAKAMKKEKIERVKSQGPGINRGQHEQGDVA